MKKLFQRLRRYKVVSIDVQFWRLLLILVGLNLAPIANTYANDETKPDPKMEAQIMALSENLRCLVCQNQSIAESTAPLAQDLRNQVREQLQQGKTPQQVREYLVARYGDFVLYDPPFKATTLLLWLGPMLALVIGLIIFIMHIRRRVGETAAPLTPQQRIQAEALLEAKAPLDQKQS